VVGGDLVTYRPTGGSQSVEVGDGATATAVVAYTGTPLELALELVAEGLLAPVFVTAPEGDPRLFVVERDGRILVIKNGALLPTPFLDIRNRANFTGERGLLGMAFDPDYATNGIFYTYYVDHLSNLALERFTSTPGSDVATREAGIVLTFAHGGSEHHGGMIEFGPDGMLYLAPGDGGCCGDPNNNAQNLGTLLGKILRIDVRTTPYTVPPSNPFAGQAGRRGEIWAYGLRSPWRFSFDEPTGMLYLGDVGENTREEVNAVPASAAGLNYGWRLTEGMACFNPSVGCAAGRTLTYPVHEYLHAEGCSVIGGYVYRGPSIPALTGHYLYSDFCRGWLRSFRLVGGNATRHRTWVDITAPRTVSFGRDGVGELYMVGDGKVWRIVSR
jgi:glucose/arabinose dehydrogenase